jgi:hypothetical protein
LKLKLLIVENKVSYGAVLPETAKPQRAIAIYLIVFWMAINLLLFVLLLPEDYMDLNNWIEIALWITSIAGLLSMKKWGAAFATFTLCYTLSTSMGILIYYQVWLNAVRVTINVLLIVYMFKSIFAGKFK